MQRQLETAPCIRVGESGARVACGARVDPEIDRVDGWTMESSRLASEKSSRSIESIVRL